MNDIYQVALGYSPASGRPIEDYQRRFRNAQMAGRNAFERRTPGYFTFNAMPFGGTYIYKSTWYVWINPQSHDPQAVPLPVGDLASMRRLRTQDLNTRQATTRSVQTADHLEEQRQALQRQDWQALRDVQGRMIEDGSLGELISGFYGLPYEDIPELIDQLASQGVLFQFQRQARYIRRYNRRLTQAYTAFGQQLARWAMLHTGVPHNAPQLALQQAQRRLANL